MRDLALFDCGIDAKLRGCELVKLRGGEARATDQDVVDRGCDGTRLGQLK